MTLAIDRQMVVRVAGLAVAALFLVAVAGCNTAEGIGEDIEATGEAIDEAAS